MKDESKDMEQIIKQIKDIGVLEAIGEGISIQDTDFKVLYQNKIHKDLFGDHSGRHCYEAYALRDKVCENCPVHMVFKNGFIHRMEKSITTDNKTRYLSITASPLKDSTGKIVAGIEIIRDITERKNTEEKISALKEFSDNIIEKSPIGIHVVDNNFIVKIWNSYFEDYTGIKKEAIIGKNLFEVIPNLASTGWDKNYKKVIETGEPFINYGYRYVRSIGPKKGEVLYQSSKIVPLKEGVNTIGAITLLEDITDKKKMEDELQKREEELRLAFENAKDAIFWADAETGVIIKCNKAAEELLGKKRKEIIGQSQTTLHPPRQSEYYAKLFQRHIAQKEAIDEEAEVITKSGEIKFVHITASVTSIGEKQIIQGIFRDITDRKRMENEFKEKVEELERFYDMAINRELRMKELKEEIEKLEAELSQYKKE